MIYQDPVKTLTYVVPESLDAVRSKLSAVVVRFRFQALWPFSRERKLFYGEMCGDSFRLIRIIHFGNPHHPVAFGCLKPDPQGTKVIVDLCPTFAGALFDFVWYGLWILFVVFALLVGSWKAKLEVLAMCVGMNLFARLLSRLVQNLSEDLYEGGFEEVFHLKVQNLD